METFSTHLEQNALKSDAHISQDIEIDLMNAAHMWAVRHEWKRWNRIKNKSINESINAVIRSAIISR